MPHPCFRFVCFGFVLIVAGHANGADLDEPTHAEVKPIRFDIGPNGKIETMAMDAKGRLLCGVSFTTNNRQPAGETIFRQPQSSSTRSPTTKLQPRRTPRIRDQGRRGKTEKSSRHGP